jgi:hypothetical protein
MMDPAIQNKKRCVKVVQASLKEGIVVDLKRREHEGRWCDRTTAYMNFLK